ncbi:MAG: protein translocase subunit SecF [Actinobacteria bacterium HGW-Actinobacteria-1]|nr:MAG: protein translocase subunit SecF [Actinobacteria bacterium HGW-Actinobacteria-1]
MRRAAIDFMGKRNWFFIASAIIIVVGLVSLFTKGLVFGIEFQGGTVMTFQAPSTVTAENIRGSLDKAGVTDARNATIQSTQDGTFLVRTTESDPTKAAEAFKAVVADLKLPAQDVTVTTIGPGWGRSVTNSALLALAISILAILIYISIRFEYKMSVTAVIALVHDTLIVLGVYSLFGREVTPNTMAALLTILGYSLYDTIVVFHRIRENSRNLQKQTFMQMANESINQVLMRWVNTSLTSVVPVTCLLLFGGDTLKDFAFALVVGMLSGAYSSVGVASTVYALWKEREPKFQALKKKYEAAKAS